MRLVIAMMKHETNTFSPVPTPLARFARGGAAPLYGDDAVAAFRDTGSAMAAYIDLAEAEGAEYVVPIAAHCWPSGPVEDAAYAHITDCICDCVAAELGKGLDAILLDLHGAMVTESLEDGEGALLARLRGIAPETPIAVALDMHTNMYPAIVDNATAVAGYQTYPHIDVYETGQRAGRAVLAALKGDATPTMAWGNRPMLPHVMRQGSDDEPNRGLQARAKKMEQQGALCASFFTGFPHADIANAGSSAVVVTDDDQALADRLCAELLDQAWANREAFVYQLEPLADSLDRAAQITDGPVILLDHFDNAASGGTMDTTVVLAAILDAGLENVAAFAIHDPAAVEQMIAAGEGAAVTVSLGGKIAMPTVAAPSPPLEVTGTVKRLSDGQYRNKGPMSAGVLMDMGPTAVLDTGRVEIVVISRHQEPNDLACLESLGIDPLTKRYIMLKSRVHWRAGFKPIARAVVDCAGVGVCTSDYDQLDFRNVRRPIFPLDADAQA